MAGIVDVSHIWKNIRELDLRPIRESAEQGLVIALVGTQGSGRQMLADKMRVDPARTEMQTQTSVLITGLEDASAIAGADLVILVVDAASEEFTREQEMARSLANSGKKVLTYAKSSADPASLLEHFVPAVIELLPDQLLALGRQFPLFRVSVARQLINDTCFSNAAYTLSTGIAEVVPIFDVPLNIADLIVLTKAQAFLVYKLGLAFGFSTRWQDYIAEFGSVIGSGFIWRQLARFLVGLIPVWGIVPKVAVAYSGTYVVGNAVLQWYLTGRHLTRKQMRDLSAQAFLRGKALARSLLDRAPRPRLGKGRGTKATPESLPAPASSPAPASLKTCPHCGKNNASDAVYCQYCGQRLDPEAGS